MSRNKNKKNKPKITITELLAVESTAPARKLLQKYGKSDPTGYEDLQVKLSELYRDTDDKKALEKEIADIHPHKDFILKNLAPTPVAPEQVVKKEIKEEPVIAPKQMTVIHDGYSSAEGGQRRSCSCGCSGFDGTGPRAAQAVSLEPRISKDLLILGIFAITALIIYKHNK